MIGIENVNEFYTNHYLAAIVGGDVRPHLERWRGDAKDSEAATPWRRLALLQQPFFRFKEQLDRVRGGEARVKDHHEIAAQLLDALGYTTKPLHRELPAGPLPLLGAWARADGEPLLWLLAAPRGHGVEEGVLARQLLPEQHSLVPDLPLNLDKGSVHQRTVEELVTDAFGLEDPPRFVLVLGDTEWVLADRGKWAEQRLLRFDWVELLGRRETDVLEVVTALLHRETLAPESGTSLVDTLNDSSHKHAYEVSEDLKGALRDSIERIGNEAIRYRTEVSKKKVYGEEIDGQQLAIECIRYMYRILFMLYIEARPELGYAPMGSEAYQLGYSFERLRDLEMLELDTQEAREGFYIDSCLKRLFKMVYEGTPVQQQQNLLAESAHHTFQIVPLRSHLFDPSRTPFLNQVKLRNEVLLEVIRSMSLSAPQGKGKFKRRGRISYATLGINQLGAVYEALLSFRGFFAEETLYEVKPAKGDNPDPIKDPAYFVPEADLGQYKKAERVFDEDGKVKAYPPGSFIYRMAGRDRQKSASYYTPEVLTKCLVKYALKELLEDDDGKPKFARAEDLLELTICEPAMGSAAFLNEAVNQLSERYLQLRQQELGERIPHDQYLQELQRVRMYIADNNVYGVDLNPIALELAEVSLWLNAIFTEETARGQEVFVPWFGGQLACGNSLVGAWRKVFPRKVLDAGKDGKNSGWLDAVPERIMLGTPRPKDSVYHFLLPDRGMAVYGQGNEGKPIREMCTEELAAIEVWRAKMCAPLSKSDREALVRLSDAVDRLWTKHIELFKQIRERTTDPLSVYGHEHPLKGRGPTTTEEKDRIWSKEMASEQVRASSPYRRLKLAMDYWCALWFWPIEKAELLPDRDEWLTDLALLLDDDVLPALRGGEDQRELFAPTMPADAARSLVDEVGFADVERLIERWPRLRLADQLAQMHRFFHWELEHSDLMSERGGFDAVIG
ncbi:MAG TPA: DNA methyltransferase, partial [Enhygromyxa sp.]|nr:DNA methyltransferase [Enhygromyxa sp.]